MRLMQIDVFTGVLGKLTTNLIQVMKCIRKLNSYQSCSRWIVLLKERNVQIGNWLFRWRSYLPLLMLSIALIGMRDFSYIDNDHNADLLWESICLLVSISGLVIRAMVIGFVPEGTSGRNTLSQKATVLNVTGFYSLVRHPLYLGNFFIWLGVSLFVRNWMISLITVLVFWIYYERIIHAEEDFLQKQFGDSYVRWAENTPCIFPRSTKWASPGMPFKWKKVLKDEYSGFFAIIATFTVLEILGDWIIDGKLTFDWEWQVLFGFGLTVYLILRLMKKKGLLG
jgi:protein-S-isoprenylcysteine O-methyltransferase Ste14